MTMFWWFLSLHMGHSYTLSHLTCLTQPYEKFSSASHARCRRQKAETKTCCDDDKMVITVDIESCWTFWMALWIVQMIIHDLWYPNKLTDCVFFVEVLFYAFTYKHVLEKIMKKIHVLISEKYFPLELCLVTRVKKLHGRRVVFWATRHVHPTTGSIFHYQK